MPQASAAGVRLSLRSGGGHHMRFAGGAAAAGTLWDQFAALLPDRPVYDLLHPLRCHRPRICDRMIFGAF
jgi:hypothetical protein